MNPLKALRRLRKRLFNPPATKQLPNDRDAYWVQIGLDFGTAFSKCICRDLNIDKVWVHKPVNCGSKELPFLIPCNLAFKNGYLSIPYQSNGSYLDGGLPHLKMALQKVSLREWKDPVLRPYQEVRGETGVAEFVKACSVYLLAGMLGGVKREIEKQFPGQHQEDYAAVNMALPVADVNKPDVKIQFQEVLKLAWVLAEKLTDYPKTKVTDIISLMNEYESDAAKNEVCEACCLYPEVGANVQGFVRSRVSSPGIYLFSDTGAGTVDQSLFIYSRRDGENRITFLHAAVFPLGSSYIERHALVQAGEEFGPKNLEKWRRLKEAGEDKEPLFIARHKVGEELESKTMQTITQAKLKLPVKSQMNKLKIIFGGGGLCRIPYEKYVLKQFDSHIFPKEEIKERKLNGDLSPIGMPMPTDLSSEEIKQHWMKRLNVAYGLAFYKSDLTRYKLPSEVETPKPEKIFRTQAKMLSAPSKDDC